MKQRQSTRKSDASNAPSSTSAPRHHNQQRTSTAPENPTYHDPFGEALQDMALQQQQSKRKKKSYLAWIYSEREGLAWIVICAALGMLLGFGVGAGWLTRGSGSYQYLIKDKRILGAMSTKVGYVPKKALKHFVVSSWRVALAKRVRKTMVYQLLTFKKAPWRIVFDFSYGLFFSQKTSPNQHWIAASPLWPPNWILFREVDLSQIDVGGGGLSPVMVSCLSFVLPWRKNLIRALARKDRVKVNLRDQDGNTIEPSISTPSSSSSSSFSSSLLSSKPSTQPINPYYHPMAFHTLREYIIRFDNGYVHPDLGFLVPAPSGKYHINTIACE